MGHDTKFEFECYDLGHLYNRAWIFDHGWIKPPFFMQMVFGILGGVGPDLVTLCTCIPSLKSFLGKATSGRCLLPGGIRYNSHAGYTAGR